MFIIPPTPLFPFEHKTHTLTFIMLVMSFDVPPRSSSIFNLMVY